jgi:DNA-binding NtrC family response regulator
VRVIAATQSASRNDSLRPDVHYRLAVLVCDVPPLRMRSGDVPMLVERFMADAQRELRRGPFSLGSGVVSTLAQHDWPGNVRELKNLIRRLVALASDGVIAVKDLPADVRGLDRHVDAPPSCCRCGFPVGDVSVQQEGPAARKTRSVARADEHADAPIVERTGDEARFLAALAGARSASDAARALGIARSTFYRRLKRHGVEVRHSFQSAATDETNVGHDDDEPTDVAPPSSVSAHHDDS